MSSDDSPSVGNAERERRIRELRAEIEPALDELDRGDFIEVDSSELGAFFDQIMLEVDRELIDQRTTIEDHADET